MEYIAGLLLALCMGLAAHALGFDKDRSFYATILVVIASYYLLFAAMASSGGAWVHELLAFGGFAFVAAWGAKRWLGGVVLGLVAHAIFDAVHGHVIANPGVPAWWPGFCLSYDLTAAALCAVVTGRRAKVPARSQTGV